MRFLQQIAVCATVSSVLSAPQPADDGRNTKNVVNKIKCKGKGYTYEQLVGYGFTPPNARDKLGDTLGGFGSSIALDRKSWKKKKDTYTGTLWTLPDRGW